MELIQFTFPSFIRIYRLKEMHFLVVHCVNKYVLLEIKSDGNPTCNMIHDEFHGKETRLSSLKYFNKHLVDEY